MAIVTRQKSPGNLPDPKDLKNLDKEIEKTQKNVDKLEQSLENMDKSASLVCLLRLDMVADMLDKFNPKLASQVDAIANALEKEAKC